jgi:ribonuclease D
LSSTFLGLELDKDWKIRSQAWEDETLSSAHIEYASNDALVSVNVAIVVAIEQAFML